jgi:3-oxoacyl-[acyl-carrier protein] reductase
VALALSAAGARVLAAGRGAESLAELRAVARARGLTLETARADASREAGARSLVRRAGGPEILVVAAGDYWEGPVPRLTAARWEALSRSNISTALTTIQAVLPGMRRRRYGRILLFGVAGGEHPSAAPLAHAYRAAKTALLTLARGIARDVAPRGITVNVISPGIVRMGGRNRRTFGALARRIPAGRLGSPGEIARAAVFLLAEESGYITGSNLIVSGGYLI